MVQAERVGEAIETAASNQKEETFTVILPKPIEIQTFNIRKFLGRKKAPGTPRRYQKGKWHVMIQIRSQKEVKDKGRLFVQRYFKLHSHFNSIVNYNLSSCFWDPGLIPIGGIPLILFDLLR